MGTGEEHLGGVEWTDPASGLVFHDDTLSAEFHNQIPGVVGSKIAFGHLIEGRRINDGTLVHAFFMHDSNGQPLVGMREIPTPPENG